MDNTDVKYTLILDGIDRLEHSMSSAKGHTDALEGSMSHLKSVAIELIGVYAGFETLKESLSEFEKHAVAVAELTQMYKNNSQNVKENIDGLKELAEQQENLTGIHSENTMAAEDNLLKYKDLKVSYEELIPLSAELATALHTDIADAANMLGRALENPTRAARLLMQAGASPQQAEMYKHLSQTGHAAKAQAYLIDILKDKYKDLAETAYNNDPSKQLEIGFKQMKESIGELIEKGLIFLMPYIKDVFESVKSFVKFIQEHQDTIKRLGQDLLIAFGALKLYEGVMWSISTVQAVKFLAATISMSAGIQGMTVKQYALNTAMSLNPIGVVIGALTALLLIYKHWSDSIDEIRKKYETLKDTQRTDFFQEEIKNTYALYEAQLKLNKSRGDAQNIALSLERDSLRKDIENIKVIYAGNPNLQEEVSRREAAIKTLTPQIFENAGDKKGNKKSDNPLNVANKSDKVTGTKQVTINVSINKLVELIKIEATNIKEGVDSAGENTAKALLAAVDQFSASADI